ncbi:MAG: UDP-3-O-(3-hydroxymyristoyl)glucosamine N-acyltransferase [Xanthomonadales bacterium]|nr:UDP-3-O-(3-hydroxymyristoyl)glucosamine N-acyltransferase [Xanthomonadales bacterium]
MARAHSTYSLQDLSARFELELRGDGSVLIAGVGTLAGAKPDEISFLANPGYRNKLPQTRAAAVILKPEDVAASPTHCLVATDPYLAFARLAGLFDRRPAVAAGIHPSAVVADGAQIGSDVSIGPHAVIGEHCEIANGCIIGPGAVLEPGCRLGEACRLYANVTLGAGVQLGKRVIVHPGAVIGADGFGIAFATDHWEKVPQLGSVRVGDDCEIGCNTTIDRGAIEDTVLEEDVRIDNQVQIGHNVHIGAHTAIAGKAGIAGSSRIGEYCLLAGAVGISGHLNIADRTTVAAGSDLFRSVEETGTSWSGQIPAQPIRDWQRNLARLRKLDDLARRVQKIEKQSEMASDDD